MGTKPHYWKVAYGPTLYEKRTLTNIGRDHSENLLTIDYNGDGQRDLLVADSESSYWHIVSEEDWVERVRVCKPIDGGNIDIPYFELKGAVLCNYVNVTKEIKLLSVGQKAIGLDGKAQVLDINGDGLEDIVFQQGNSIKWYKNNNGSFAIAATLTSFTSSNGGAQLNGSSIKHTANMESAAGVDVNGDGRSDLIIKVTDTTTSCRLNGRELYAGSERECTRDLGGVWSSSSSTGWKLYTSTGTSLKKEQSLGNYEDVRVADLNGDGLTDILQYSSSSVWSYRLSNGQLFLPTKSLTVGSTSDTYKNSSYFIDLNKDGAVDFLKATNSTTWGVFISEYKNSEEIKYVSRGTLKRESGAVVQFGDIDGDGKLDLIEGKSGSHGWRASYAPRSGIPDYVISKITNGFGMKTEIQYSPMTDPDVYVFDYSDDDVSGVTFSPNSGMPLVRRAITDTGVGTSAEIYYQYGGFLVHRQGRGMLGFEMVSSFDPYSEITTETVYSQKWPYTGMPLHTRQTYNSELLSDSINTLATRSTSNGGVMPYISASTEKNSSIGSDGYAYKLNKTSSSFIYDSYGNLTNSTITVSDHYGNESLRTSTSNLYGTLAWDKAKGRLSQSTVTKTRNSQSQSRTSNFEYYSRYDGSTPGMLKSSTVFQDTNKELVTEYTYDHFGNKTSTTKTGAENSDGSNLQTRGGTKYYGINGRLLDYTVSAKGVRTDFRYNGTTANGVSGRITSTKNITNGVSITNTFNNFGQIKIESVSGSSSTYTYQEFCSQVSCDNSSALYRVRIVKDGYPERRAYFDFLGREVESRTKNFSGGWTKIFRTYDSRGRSAKVYEPTNSYKDSYSESTYDRFGRVIQIRNPNGGVTKTEYFGLKTDSIDARTIRTQSWQTPQGELKEVKDAKGSRLIYQYNGYGDLLNVKTANSSAARYVRVSNIYDSYGFKEQTDDQDKGVFDYKYNAFGELVEQISARNHAVYLDYDYAGRLIRRYENEGTSCWNYNATTGRLDNDKFFKSANKTLSECVNDETATKQNHITYDSNGRAKQMDTSIGGVSSYINGEYSTYTTYDNYGRLDTVTYPNDLSIRKTYQNGYLNIIKNADTGRQYQNVNAMNAYGQVTSVSYANGAREIIGYDSKDGSVNSHQLSVNGSQKHYLSYVYDKNNNLTRREHEFNDKGYTRWAERLTYDDLNRLDYRELNQYDNSYLTVEFKTSHNYNYDAWGNISYKTGMGSYTYDSNKVNRLLKISGDPSSGFIPIGYGQTGNHLSYTMSYDANGNIINDGKGRSFSYFSFDKVNKITSGNLYSKFLYGADHARFYKQDKRVENNASTYYHTAYLGDYEKIHRTGGGKSALTEHKVNLGNFVITERSNGTSEENYLHKDHLGSSISITNKQGSVVQQFAYDPWGKQLKIYQDSSYANLTYFQPSNRGYTGHEEVNELGIVNMNGRVYDPSIGRFLQADPNVQSPGNTQNYNRYSYVMNNPLSMTDPSGYFFKKLFRSIKKYWKKIASITLSTWLGPLGTFIGNYLMTGSLRGALIGGLTGAIGGVFTHLEGVAGFVSNGLVGGVMSKLQGGNFGRGFMAAGLGNSMGGVMKSINSKWNRVFASAVVGGTISKISGGKFANGAYSSAFAASLRASKEGDLFDVEAEGTGEGREALGGKVIVKRAGSPNVKVSDEDLAKVEKSFKEIIDKGGENGEKLASALSVDKPLIIILNSEGANEAYLNQFKITVDLRTPAFIKDTKEPISITRIIAHEASHAVLGIKDDHNVNVQFVDSIMKGINNTVRRDYDNVCFSWESGCTQ